MCYKNEKKTIICLLFVSPPYPPPPPPPPDVDKGSKEKKDKHARRLTDAEPHEGVGFADLLPLVPHLEEQL
jgi:hypothetical protein